MPVIIVSTPKISMPENSQTVKSKSPAFFDGEDDFNTMYTFYKPKLFTITSSYINSREDAEEIVHDVLIKLWEKKETITVTTNLTGYIYRMTRNACLDYLRSHKNRLSKETTSDQQEHWLNYSALSDDAASSIIAKELQNLVENAVEHLPEKCRNVFVKSRLDGLGHKEISEQLKISPKTVENHISRALRELKTVLKEYLPVLFI